MPKIRIKTLFLLALITFLIPAAHADDIKPFTTDGCSLFPDGYLNNRELWQTCCTQHDMAYWQGGSWQQRLDADRLLKACVTQLGEPKVADLMLNGVRAGGSPYWPTRFRWGYGWDYLRGYKPLNGKEKQSVQKALREYKAKTATTNKR